MKFYLIFSAVYLALSDVSGQALPIGVPGYARGAILFQDNFDSPDSLTRWTLFACGMSSCTKTQGTFPNPQSWVNYGDAQLTRDIRIESGRLYFNDPSNKPDNHMWTPMSFWGDFGIAFDFEPDGVDYQGGHILSFCAMPLAPGGTLSGSGTGTMDEYNNTITCYHFSYAVDTRGTTHLRKNPNLIMLSERQGDPCQTRDSLYHIEIYKIGNKLFLYVDGKGIISYTDNGTQGDSIYHGGYVGIRNWTGFQAYYDNFKVFRIEKSTAAGKSPPPDAERGFRIAPNPFRSGVLQVAGTAGNGTIFDTQGRRVADLFSPPGAGRFFWDGRDRRGAEAPPGLYILRVGGPEQASRRITFIKER